MKIIKSIQKQFGLVVCIVSLINIGCSKFPLLPASVAEITSGYTYIPIDPSKVQIDPGRCSIDYATIGNKSQDFKLLDALPDNAVRLSMELSDANGQVTYGVSKIKGAGASYKLTADYVNSDTVNKKVWIGKKVLVETTTSSDGFLWLFNKRTNAERKLVPAKLATEAVFKTSNGDQKQTRIIPNSEVYEVFSSEDRHDSQANAEGDQGNVDFEEYNVPIYVGIGLRVIAQGTSLTGDVNISGVGIVGAEAEANRLLGSLMVQTLGVNSQAVASALPVHSELSRTTAENAFVAIGSIKALLHQPETINFPRVVGMYLPFPGGKPLVNALISELSRNPVKWCPIGRSEQDAIRKAAINN